MNYFRIHKLGVFILCVSFFLLFGCGAVVYEGRYFSYPPDSSPFGNTWLQRVDIRAETHTFFFELPWRNIKITIINTQKEVLLSDARQIKGGSKDTILDFFAEWPNDKSIIIKVFENSDSDKTIGDDNNGAIDGRKQLLSLHYKYNDLKGKYELVK